MDSVNPPPTDAGGVQTFKYPFSLAHKRLHEGGWSREVTVRELAVSKTLAGVNMRLGAGSATPKTMQAPTESGLVRQCSLMISEGDGARTRNHRIDSPVL